MGDEHISFTTTKIGSLLDCKNSRYAILLWLLFHSCTYGVSNGMDTLYTYSLVWWYMCSVKYCTSWVVCFFCIFGLNPLFCNLMLFTWQRLAKKCWIQWVQAKIGSIYYLHTYRIVRKNGNTEYDYVALSYSSFARASLNNRRNDSQYIQHMCACSFWLVLECFWLHRWSLRDFSHVTKCRR